MNLSYDWDGEMERQLYESPRETVFRHFKEENEWRVKNNYFPLEKIEDFHEYQKLLENDY